MKLRKLASYNVADDLTLHAYPHVPSNVIVRFEIHKLNNFPQIKADLLMLLIRSSQRMFGSRHIIHHNYHESKRNTY